MALRGLLGLGGGFFKQSGRATKSLFYFGEGVDGSLSVTSGSTNISTHPTPVAPGGACSSLRVSALTSTRITTANPNTNKFAVGDRILLYQFHTSSPNAPLTGNYSIHVVGSIPSSTTLDISNEWASVAPGSNSITTGNYEVGTGSASVRCYVVRIAQYTTISVPGGTVTANNSSPDDFCGVIALAASTSIAVNGGTISVAGLGKSGGDGAPNYPVTGGFGDSWAGPFDINGPPAVGGDQNPNVNFGGGSGGNHEAGVRSGGGGGGSAYNVGANGGEDAAGGGGPAGNVLPAPLVNIPAESRLHAGSGGGGGADSVGWPGGAGGGVILLFSPSITISSSVNARGVASPVNSSAGNDTGGGGAGGTILMRGTTVNIGTDVVTAKGGDQSGTYTPAGYGGAGGGGLVAVYAPSITGSTANSPQGTTTQNPVFFSSPFPL